MHILLACLFVCLFVCAKKGRRWSPTCRSRPWRQLGMLCFVWQTTASFFSFWTKIDKVSVGCLLYRFWWPRFVGSVWSGGGSVAHQAEGIERERETERESKQWWPRLWLQSPDWSNSWSIINSASQTFFIIFTVSSHLIICSFCRIITMFSSSCNCFLMIQCCSW